MTHKTCPFCGHEPVAARLERTDLYVIYCDNDICHVQPQVTSTDLAAASKRWDTRHD